MANQSLKTLHGFLQENATKVSSRGTVKSFSHDTGFGPVLCMVHGYPQSSYMWRKVVADLKDHITLFIPELPGYGFSSLPPQHDKRTVGRLILEALQQVFGKDRSVIWCGHDRGARIGHRLLVDNDPCHKIQSAILMDIVPTREQWAAFANPHASVAYYHWPFLATPMAPQLIALMGGGEYVKVGLDRVKGRNQDGVASFLSDDAQAHYAHQFSHPECIAGSCGDYMAGATIDCEEQEKDQDAGRKITTPLMVMYSASNLGSMHDVPKIWDRWIEGEVRYEAITDGYGHYLPEECPERVLPLLKEWIDKYAK